MTPFRRVWWRNTPPTIWLRRARYRFVAKCCTRGAEFAVTASVSCLVCSVGCCWVLLRASLSWRAAGKGVLTGAEAGGRSGGGLCESFLWDSRLEERSRCSVRDTVSKFPASAHPIAAANINCSADWKCAVRLHQCHLARKAGKAFRKGATCPSGVG